LGDWTHFDEPGNSEGIRGEAETLPETEMAGNAADHLRMPWVIIAFGANDARSGKSCIRHRMLATIASETKSKLLCQINDLFQSDLPTPPGSNRNDNAFSQWLVDSGNCFLAFGRKGRERHHKKVVQEGKFTNVRSR
jgi:hypothetical protein